MWSLFKGIVTEIVDKSTKKASIVFLGIDGSGKTTLVEKILTHVNPKRKPKTILPTMGLNTETIEDNKIILRFWDLGGRKVIRPVWNDYLDQANALIYVVNGEQLDRIHETRKLFDDITCKYNIIITLIFINSQLNILNIFPSAIRFNYFFIDINNKKDLEILLNWMKTVAI